MIVKIANLVAGSHILFATHDGHTLSIKAEEVNFKQNAQTNVVLHFI